MNPRDRGETDALVRRLRGFVRVFNDPVPNTRAGETAEESRLRMVVNVVEAFVDLDTRLCSGDPLPEAWDPVTAHERRDRVESFPWHYTFPPGTVGDARCVRWGRACKWIDARAKESACRRCHTIRVYVGG